MYRYFLITPILRYGLAAAFLMSSLIATANSATLSILHRFGHREGKWPVAKMIIDKKGDLYGTTPYGGNCGGGTVFKLTNGQLSILHCFGRKTAEPMAGLTADKQGNFYGTTAQGGGAVYVLSPEGKFKVLHYFTGGSDGGYPFSGLILRGTVLYGTTYFGGGSSNCDGGCGTVFSVAKDGSSEHVIYAFQGGTDGALPSAKLTTDAEGNYYGTTRSGGNPSCESAPCGTVFKVTPEGTETVLHAFVGAPTDGAQPESSLILDAQGNLYGTASYGGQNNAGAIFKLAPDGTETILHSFGGVSDGSNPADGLMLGMDGNFYGTTADGGGGCSRYGGCGTVFEMAPDGTESVLATFNYKNKNPVAGLVGDSQGNLFGAFEYGGSARHDCDPGCGGIFKVTP